MSSKSPSTVTSTGQTSPWSSQAPYLQDIFSRAQDVYNSGHPNYYPDSTVAAPTSAQTTALGGINDLAGRNQSGIDDITQSFNNNLLRGGYLWGPGLQSFASLSGTGSPWAGELNREATTNATNSPAMDTLAQLGGSNPYDANPAASAFGSYASGARTAAGNPYIDALSQNVLSQVVPGIQSQFIEGGMLSSPEAARATAAGATSALAPALFQNYQNEEANQLAGAQGQNNAYMQGLAQQLSGANTWGSQALQSLGLQQAAAGTGGSQALQAAQGMGNTYGQGIQQMLGGVALAPQVQAMPYTDLSQQYASGATQQSLNQQSLNDLINRWNFTETLPAQKLNEYIGQVTGNYGGTTSLTQPYFQNTGGNLLGGALGGASLGSTLGIGSGAGAGLGALMALI